MKIFFHVFIQNGTDINLTVELIFFCVITMITVHNFVANGHIYYRKLLGVLSVKNIYNYILQIVLNWN